MDDRKSSEAEVRAAIEDRVRAVRSRKTERVLWHYAPDVVGYNLAPPLATRGVETVRQSWETWSNSFEGEIGYELRDLEVSASGDVAFARSLAHITGARTNGEQTDMWIRTTHGFRRTEGRWLIVHEHVSTPVDMKTLKAMFDAKPAD